MRRDPLVVFFDEPTASVDVLAEQALLDRYAAEARKGVAFGAVTVLVSHRFSTVRSAGLILVIDGGGLAELAGHGQLMLRGGLYAELYSMQALIPNGENGGCNCTRCGRWSRVRPAGWGTDSRWSWRARARGSPRWT
jgi:ABC-type cobalamin transport system ATPase subunit